MEDRITPELYLKLADRSPEESAQRRVRDVLKLPELAIDSVNTFTRMGEATP